MGQNKIFGRAARCVVLPLEHLPNSSVFAVVQESRGTRNYNQLSPIVQSHFFFVCSLLQRCVSSLSVNSPGKRHSLISFVHSNFWLLCEMTPVVEISPFVILEITSFFFTLLTCESFKKARAFAGGGKQSNISYIV